MLYIEILLEVDKQNGFICSTRYACFVPKTRQLVRNSSAVELNVIQTNQYFPVNSELYFFIHLQAHKRIHASISSSAYVPPVFFIQDSISQFLISKLLLQVFFIQDTISQFFISKLLLHKHPNCQLSPTQGVIF